MMILCQGAPFDIATTSGIAQSVMLRFVDSDGAAKDISGNTFRCAVRGPGAAAIKCEPIDATSARLAWSPLKAGAHAYDLFMIAPDGAERPLIMGEIQAAPRITPPGNEDVVTIGDIKIIVPDAADGEVKIIDPSADAAERAEAAAQKAETAGTDANTARKDAENALKLANDASASAQKALAAIPQVDAAGNMTLAGGLTTAGTHNANGGINIPLAAGAATDTTAVSRAYALGLAHAAMMHQTRTYWVTSSCTATNGVTINHVVPGCYCEARLGVNQHTSLTMCTTGVVGGSNYSKNLGYSLPIRVSGAGVGYWTKVSMIIGSGGEWTEYPDAGRDDYRFRPVAGSSPDISRLVDVTIYYNDGYKARVRELIGIGNPRQYIVRTTESAINYNSNTGLASAAYRLVISQSELSYTDALAASVWLIIGGAAIDTVIKLADIRGWDTYHTSYAPTLYLDVQVGEYGGIIQMESPTILNGIGNNTYVSYGLEPYQRSWITSETEEPYTEPEQPTEL